MKKHLCQLNKSVYNDDMTTLEKIKNMFFWGFILWLLGYITGIALFFAVPKNYIGWIIMPMATVLTIWILIYRVKRPELMCYLGTGFIWMIMAVVLDYIFIVVLLKTGNTYYKLDVFIYYFLTLTLPIAVGYWKFKHKAPKAELF
jgi:hypothetical protein